MVCGVKDIFLGYVMRILGNCHVRDSRGCFFRCACHMWSHAVGGEGLVPEDEFWWLKAG